MLILRNETFGGTIFNTTNATLLRLDEEAFIAVLKHLYGVKLLENESELISEIGKNGISDFSKAIIRTAGLHLRKDDLFVTEGPELIDFQITYRCDSFCPHCYVDAGPTGAISSFPDVIHALDEFSAGRVLQVAYGGGEPTLHPDLAVILKETWDRSIIPNLTTNGKKVPTKVIDAIHEYCGAVAFSVEETGEEFRKRRGYNIQKLFELANSLIDVGINVVFHVTVSGNNLEQLPQIAAELVRLNPYGIVFLVHKPVGRGSQEETLVNEKPQAIHKKIQTVVSLLRGKTNVGFDGCFAPGLSLLSLQSEHQTYEGCSAARTSANVTPGLDVRPCSFIEQVGGNLNTKELLEIWNSDPFENFRHHMAQHISSCQCGLSRQCLAGCPMMSLIPCTLPACADTS